MPARRVRRQSQPRLRRWPRVSCFLIWQSATQRSASARRLRGGLQSETCRKMSTYFKLAFVAFAFYVPAPVRVALAQSNGSQQVWFDQQTRLMWTAADSGSGLSLSQAKRYCQESSVAGFKDWTLPSIDDLQGVFGGPENPRGHHIRGPMKLTGWQWSATPGKQDGEGWVLDFGDGGRASVAAGDSGLNRALCIRYVKSK
jgi:Protein of unknown function (DUF1566)